MAPSFSFSEKTEPLSIRYARDYEAMGKIGAYMSIREDMAKAFNAASTDGPYISQPELATLLGTIREDPAGAEAQFAAADVQSRGRITFEEWTKAFLDAS